MGRKAVVMPPNAWRKMFEGVPALEIFLVMAPVMGLLTEPSMGSVTLK